MLVSRSGTGPERRRAYAGRRPTPRTPTGSPSSPTGAVALYNCVNPPSYTVWPTFWPPVAAAFLAAAERTGATLVTASCLYGYGPVDGPMVEGLPDAATTKKARIRARMWADALAGPRGRPDRGRRGARLGLHGAAGVDRDRPHRPGAPRRRWPARPCG